MAGEDTAGWKRLSGFCGDLWIVEISGGAVIACSPESCASVVNKSIHQSKPSSIFTHIHVTVLSRGQTEENEEKLWIAGNLDNI
jgi:hypothetical protein